MIETMKERTTRICADPDTLDNVVGHIANGGNLIDLCRTWDVRYSDIVMWLNNDEVRKKSFYAALDARNEWAIQRILGELNALAFVDIRGIFDENHELLPPNKWPDDVARAIAGIEVNELKEHDGERMVVIGEVKKVKLYDKLKSIELLGKDLGRFVSKHEVTGRLTLEDLVTGSQTKE